MAQSHYHRFAITVPERMAARRLMVYARSRGGTVRSFFVKQ